MAPVIFPQTFLAGKALEDGSLINSAIAQPLLSSQTGIVARAGGGITNATQLYASTSLVTTVATTGDSVKLPPAVPMVMWLQNAGASTMTVFATGSDTINNQSIGVGFSQSAGLTIAYICFTKGIWFPLASSGGFLAGNVFGPDTPATNAVPVWQDPLTPGSDGDTLVNSVVNISPLSGNITGVGTITTTGAIITRVVVLTDAATIAWNASTQPCAQILLTAGVGASRILGYPTGLVPGYAQDLKLRVQQSAGGNNDITFDAGYTTPGGIFPTFSMGANAVDYITGYYDGANVVVLGINGVTS